MDYGRAFAAMLLLSASIAFAWGVVNLIRLFSWSNLDVLLLIVGTLAFAASTAGALTILF